MLHMTIKPSLSLTHFIYLWPIYSMIILIVLYNFCCPDKNGLNSYQTIHIYKKKLILINYYNSYCYGCIKLLFSALWNFYFMRVKNLIWFIMLETYLLDMERIIWLFYSYILKYAATKFVQGSRNVWEKSFNGFAILSVPA